jgi:hypothetical protein
MDDDSRRTFVKRAVYVAPAILTLKAASAYASYGSSPTNPKATHEAPDESRRPGTPDHPGQHRGQP